MGGSWAVRDRFGARPESPVAAEPVLEREGAVCTSASSR